METIALIGDYDSTIKAIFRQSVPDGFILKELTCIHCCDELEQINYAIVRGGMGKDLINMMPRLKLIQRWGVGCDKVDIQAAGMRNIPVAIASGISAASVSEMAILLMLAVYRKLPLLHANVLAGKWREGNGIISTSFEIEGKTVGLIGCGAIGKRVAQKLRAFGATIQYYDLHRLAPEEEERLGVHYINLNSLFETADIISLHVPLTPSTKHLINKSSLSLMKPTAIIVNTSRGDIVKEIDLLDALTQHKILGAGLDVSENEPLDLDSPLLRAKNIVLTPHMGASTFDANVNMVKRCLDNIRRISKNERLLSCDFVNVGYFNNPDVFTTD